MDKLLEILKEIRPDVDFENETALIDDGILDSFMDSKGLITPEEWRGFCSDCVILGIFPDYCLSDLLSMQIALRYYRPEPVQDKLHYVVERGKQILKEGTIDVNIEGQGLFDIGEISVGLPTATKVHRIDVKLTLGDPENHYAFWQCRTNCRNIFRGSIVLISGAIRCLILFLKIWEKNRLSGHWVFALINVIRL